MKATQVIGSGLAGAIALNILHETARRFFPQAPRMDILGMRAITKTMQKANAEPPHGNKLYWLAMAGDVISNAAYYSLTASDKSKNVWLKGAMLGLGAGLGAVTLPGPLGLGTQPSARTNTTKIMTVAWYLVGGLATAAAFQFLNKITRK
jgi:hypothetical protein